ncbi:MAG: hypothetical protein M3Q30_20315 [Actinomycetota bacterium]|nr:hypothetical protein [Actinomycetota bacterium]
MDEAGRVDAVPPVGVQVRDLGARADGEYCRLSDIDNDMLDAEWTRPLRAAVLIMRVRSPELDQWMCCSPGSRVLDAPGNIDLRYVLGHGASAPRLVLAGEADADARYRRA